MKSALALFDKYRNVVVVLTKSKATIFLNSLVTSNANQCLLHDMVVSMDIGLVYLHWGESCQWM